MPSPEPRPTPLPRPLRRPFLVFVLAILLPGLALGALALRSLRLQEAYLERERHRLLQSATDRLAEAVSVRLDEVQRDFSLRVESLLGTDDPAQLAAAFDDRIRAHWTLAEIGFAVSLSGTVHAPGLQAPPASLAFLQRNAPFLCRSDAAEVFANNPKGQISLAVPQQAGLSQQKLLGSQTPPATAMSSRFRDLVGDGQEGVLSRFLDDQLAVWVWYRTPRNPDLVFGAQIAAQELRQTLATFVATATPPAGGATLALLDERGNIVSRSPQAPPPGESLADWRHPLAVSFIGANLPLWRVAATLPEAGAFRSRDAGASALLASIILLMVTALAAGGWLVITDARRQLAVARQKADFVSTVSHELRTPLTSIRLSAELLAEQRVREESARERHLRIIQAEATRLQRLITNVLEFAAAGRSPRHDRREHVDLEALLREVLESFAPQFDALSMRVSLQVDHAPVRVSSDPDAVAQIAHNLLSNALKYAGQSGTLDLLVRRQNAHVELLVQDRGPGVPPGLEERIFEPFFRADDSLTQGVPGAGIGLALARQTARDLDGQLHYRARDGGGSSFVLTLPADPLEAETARSRPA